MRRSSTTVFCLEHRLSGNDVCNVGIHANDSRLENRPLESEITRKLRDVRSQQVQFKLKQFWMLM